MESKDEKENINWKLDVEKAEDSEAHTMNEGPPHREEIPKVGLTTELLQPKKNVCLDPMMGGN